MIAFLLNIYTFAEILFRKLQEFPLFLFFVLNKRMELNAIFLLQVLH